MREQFVPGAPAVLLLDLDGAAREALGVEEGVSVVLVYDAGGALVHVERGEPDRGRAEQAWKALAAASDT